MNKQLLGAMLLGLLLTTGCQGQDTESVINEAKKEYSQQMVLVDEDSFIENVVFLEEYGIMDASITGVNYEDKIVVLTTDPRYFSEGLLDSWETYVEAFDEYLALEGVTYYVEFLDSDEEVVALLQYLNGKHDFKVY